MRNNFFIKVLIFLVAIILIKPSYADDKIVLGKEVFNNKAMCGTCHVLEESGSVGNIGPNLDLLKPSLERIVYVVSNGIGVMQSWEGILSKEEIEAVAYYVFKSTN